LPKDYDSGNLFCVAVCTCMNLIGWSSLSGWPNNYAICFVLPVTAPL